MTQNNENKRRFLFVRTTPGMPMSKAVYANFNEKSENYVLNRNQINGIKSAMILDFRTDDIVVMDDCNEKCDWMLHNNNRLSIEMR